MGIVLLVKVCTLAATFEQRYAADGKSYLQLLWTGDGYELYICKTYKGRKQKLVNKTAMSRLLTKQTGLLEGIVAGALKSTKQPGVSIYQKIADPVKAKRNIIIEEDGNVIVEP